MDIKRIKDLREDKDMLQKDIADKINITQPQYSLYEMGIRKIPIDKLCELANFHNTSTDYILGLTDVKEPYPRKEKK